ncbi:hypothetical protein PLESTM_000326100 [Pleodorina starrii]|nr:hypothetical protein PLESTM_000326100 [Pleodorina starrii]
MPIGLLRDTASSGLLSPKVVNGSTGACGGSNTTCEDASSSANDTSPAVNALKKALGEGSGPQLLVPCLSPSSIPLYPPRISQGSASSDGGHASCAEDMCSLGPLSNRTSSIGGSSCGGAGRSFGGSSLHGLAYLQDGAYHSQGGASCYNNEQGCSSGGLPQLRPRLPHHAAGSCPKVSVLPRISTLGAVAEQYDGCEAAGGDDSAQSPAAPLPGPGYEPGGWTETSPSFGLVTTLGASWQSANGKDVHGVEVAGGTASPGADGDGDATHMTALAHGSHSICSSGGGVSDGCAAAEAAAWQGDGDDGPDGDESSQLETPSRVGAMVALFDDAIRRSSGTGFSLRTSANSSAAAAASPLPPEDQSPVLFGGCSRIARPPLRVGNSSGGCLRTAPQAPSPSLQGHAPAVASADRAAHQRLHASQPAPGCMGGRAGAARAGNTASSSASRAAALLPVSTSSRPQTRSACIYSGSAAPQQQQQQPQQPNKRGVAPRTSTAALAQAPARPPFNLYGKRPAKQASTSMPGDSRPSSTSASSPVLQPASATASGAGTECAGPVGSAARRPGTRPTRPGGQVSTNSAAAAAPTPSGQPPAGRRLSITPPTITTATTSRANSTLLATAAAGPARPGTNSRNSRPGRAPGNPVYASTPLSPSGKKVLNTAPSSAVARAAAAAAATFASAPPPSGTNPRGALRRPVCRYSVDSVCSEGIPSARQPIHMHPSNSVSPREADAASSPQRLPEQRLGPVHPRTPASPLPAMPSPADTLPLLRSPCLFSPVQPPPPLAGMDDMMPMASPIPAAVGGGSEGRRGGAGTRRRRLPDEDGWSLPLPESPRLSASEASQRGEARSAKRRAARARAAAAAMTRSGGGAGGAGSGGSGSDGDDFGLPAWAWGSVATLISQSVEASGLRESCQRSQQAHQPLPPAEAATDDGPKAQLPGYAHHDPSLVPLRRLSGTPHRRRGPKAAAAGFRLASAAPGDLSLVGHARNRKRPTSPDIDAEGTAVLLSRQAAARGRYSAERRVPGSGGGGAPASSSSDSEEPSEPLPLPAPDEEEEAGGCWLDDDAAAGASVVAGGAGARLLPALSGACHDAMVFASLHRSSAGPPRPAELLATSAADATGGDALTLSGAFAAAHHHQHLDEADAMAATTPSEAVRWAMPPCASSPPPPGANAVAGHRVVQSDGGGCGWDYHSPCQPGQRGSLGDVGQGHGQHAHRRRPSVERLDCKLAQVLEGLRAVASSSCDSGLGLDMPLLLQVPTAYTSAPQTPLASRSSANAAVDAAGADAPSPLQVGAGVVTLGAVAEPVSCEAAGGCTALELSAVVAVLSAVEALLSGSDSVPSRGASAAGAAPLAIASAAADAATTSTAWGAVWTAAVCAAGVMAAAANAAASTLASVFAAAGVAAAVLLASKARARRRRSGSQRGGAALAVVRVSVSGLGSSALGPPAVAAGSVSLRTWTSAVGDASRHDSRAVSESAPGESREQHAASSSSSGVSSGSDSHSEAAAAERVGEAEVAAEEEQEEEDPRAPREDAGGGATEAAGSGGGGAGDMLGIAAEAAETCREAITAMRAAGADRETLRRLARACGAFAGMQMAAAGGGGSGPPDVAPADWSMLQDAVRQRLGRQQPPAVDAESCSLPAGMTPTAAAGAVPVATLARQVPALAARTSEAVAADVTPSAAGHAVGPESPRLAARVGSADAGTPPRQRRPVSAAAVEVAMLLASPQAKVRVGAALSAQRELLAMVSMATGADAASATRGRAAVMTTAVMELARSPAGGGGEAAAAEAAVVALAAARRSIGEQGALETLAEVAGSLLPSGVDHAAVSSARGPVPETGSALELLAQECRSRHAAYARAAATCSSISALAAVAETAALEALAICREEALAAHAAEAADDAQTAVRGAEAAEAALLHLLQERSEVARACFAVEAAAAAASLRAATGEADALAALAAGRERMLREVVSRAVAADAALAARAGAASARAVLAMWSRQQLLLSRVGREAAAGAATAVRAADAEAAAVAAYAASRRQVLSLASLAAGSHAADDMRGSAALAESIQDLVLARARQLRLVSEAAAVDSAAAIAAADREEAACRVCAARQLRYALACVATEAASGSAASASGAVSEEAALARLAKARRVLAGVCFAVEAMDAATSVGACAAVEAAMKALARRRVRCRTAYAAATAAAAATAVAAAAGEDVALEQLRRRRQHDLSDYAGAVADTAAVSAAAAAAEDAAQEELVAARSAELVSHAASEAAGAAAAVQALACEEAAVWAMAAARQGLRACLVDVAVGTGDGYNLGCVSAAAADAAEQALQVCALAYLEMQRQRLSLYATFLGTSLGALAAAASASAAAGGQRGLADVAGRPAAAAEVAPSVVPAMGMWPYALTIRGFPLRSLGGASVGSEAEQGAIEEVECGQPSPMASCEASGAPGSCGVSGVGVDEVTEGEESGQQNGACEQPLCRGRQRSPGKRGPRRAVVVRSFGLRRRLQSASTS